MGHRKGSGNGSRKGQAINRGNDRMSKPHVGTPGRRGCFGDAPSTATRQPIASNEPRKGERGRSGSLLRGA